ncbi:MAG: DNA primase, partial [Candidatus Celaenobacter antarcticus]|nr:DNA primase [Candidatus Celaenobacter antarcticus]
MKKFIVLIFILLMNSLLFALEPHFMQQPAISPDGNTVCFSYMSNLWTVPLEGGEAKRLTVSKGNDTYPVFSPDGKTIAFNSNRDGFHATYLIPAEGGVAECICKEGVTVIDWFSNGKKILATKYELPNGWNFMELPLDGSHPTLITEIGSSFAQLTPDNKNIIYSDRGYNTRERYIGSVSGQIWEYDIKNKSYTQLTDAEYTEKYPVCSYVNDHIYFVGTDFVKENRAVFQIYSVEGMDFPHPQKLTKFDYWSATQLCIARQNDNMVFKRFDELWSYNATSGKFKKIPIEIRQDFIGSFEVTERFINQAQDFSVSTNGKLVAFTYKFDLFAMPEKGGEVKQLTHDQNGIGNIAIADDDQTIYFTGYEKGNKQLYKTNVKEPDTIEKISWFKDDYVQDIYFEDEMGLFVQYSDDKAINQIALVEKEENKVQKLITDQVVGSRFTVSPDKKYALYFELTSGTWDEILYLYNFETKEKTAIYPYHGNMHSPIWGEQGAYVFFNRNQDICRMELHAKEDFWDYKDYWEDILNPKKDDDESENKDEEKDNKEDKKDAEKEKTEKDSVKVVVDLQDIRKRVKVIASKQGYNYLVATDKDSTLYYLNNSEDDVYTLRKVDYEGKKDEEITTFFSRPRNMIYNEENSCFYYIESGSLKKITTSGTVETLENEFEYKYNSLALNKTVFEQAWKAFQRGFYDPDMNKIDWDKAFKKYYPYMEYAYSPEIMDEIYSEMMGEVNASHTGFYARNDNPVPQHDIAYGGFVLDFKNIPKKGIKFKTIYRKSKLNKPYNIKPGDVLLEVDGVKITEDTPITPLF